MKKISIALILVFAAAPLMALDAYPMTTVAELATSVG